MEISDKVAYLKGLAEGLNLDTDSKEGKLIAAIIDVLDDMAEKFAEVDDELCDVEDGLDAVSDDLSDVEETLYFALDDDEDDDEDDEEEECFVTTCPECEEEVYFDESVLEDGEVVCPHCGAKPEFDLSDLAAAAEDSEDEELFPQYAAAPSHGWGLLFAYAPPVTERTDPAAASYSSVPLRRTPSVPS